MNVGTFSWLFNLVVTEMIDTKLTDDRAINIGDTNLFNSNTFYVPFALVTWYHVIMVHMFNLIILN